MRVLRRHSAASAVVMRVGTPGRDGRTETLRNRGRTGDWPSGREVEETRTRTTDGLPGFNKNIYGRRRRRTIDDPRPSCGTSYFTRRRRPALAELLIRLRARLSVRFHPLVIPLAPPVRPLCSRPSSIVTPGVFIRRSLLE